MRKSVGTPPCTMFGQLMTFTSLASYRKVVVAWKQN